MLMEGGQVAGMRKHPYGRVDQLEDRYLGMVEAPSSNLGTSTSKRPRFPSLGIFFKKISGFRLIILQR